MSAPNPVIGREEAANLNPLISSLWTEDTLAVCARTISSLGTLISCTSNDVDYDQGGLFLVFETITAALRYESRNVRSADVERKKKAGGAP